MSWQIAAIIVLGGITLGVVGQLIINKFIGR